MKPIKVAMQAFGSYTAKTTIDFKKLYNDNIFLIAGSTGSGKTTILDAICFALYCRATGGLRSWKDMRNISVAENVPTLVDFEFILNNESYRFTRSIKLHHKRKSNEIEFRSEHACYKMSNKTWELIHSGSESKVRDFAEQLIGLDCDQFSKVIILPQGEFKNLLLSNTHDKSKIFQKLFCTTYWENLSKSISAVAKNISTELSSLTIKETTILKQENVNNITELIEKQKICEKEYCIIKSKLSETEKYLSEISSCIEKYKNLSSASESLKIKEKELKHHEKILKEAQQSFKSADLDAKNIPNLKIKIKNIISNIASDEKNLESYKKLENLDKKITLLNKEKNNINIKIDSLKNEIYKLESSLRKGEDYLKLITEEAKLIPNLFLEYEKQKNVLESLNLILKLKLEQEDLVHKLNVLKNNYKNKSTNLCDLKNKYSSLQKLVDMDKAYSLSIGLKDGVPCPVCGSIDHPKLAISQNLDIAINDNISFLEISIDKENQDIINLKSEILSLEDRIDKKANDIQEISKKYQAPKLDINSHKIKLNETELKLQNAQKAEKHIKPSTIKIDKLKLDLETKKDKLKEAEKEHLSISKDIENVNKNKEFILSYIDSNKTLQTVTGTITKNKSELKQLEIKLQNIENNVSSSKSNLDIAQTNFKLLKQNYDIEIYNYENLLKDAKKDKNIDLKELEASYEMQKKSVQGLTESLGKNSQIINFTKSSIKELKKIEDTKSKLSATYSKTNRVALFLQGKNPYNTQIQTFVLGIMLDDILSCANIYLASFSQNRYALSRITDPEKTSKRGFKGLDIEVFDAHCGSIRTINTLSGGELFLASLSLAFGLSDVVQSYSGSVHLDSIFIDEGFGSLDQDTLDTALETLQHIRKMGRLVGVISHVKAIKEQIPARIEIYTSENGSQSVKIISD